MLNQRLALRTKALMILAIVFAAQARGQDTAVGDRLINQYFRTQTDNLTQNALANINTLQDWQSKRGEHRRQLFEMLGLDPLPAKSDLSATVTGTLQQDDFLVEKLHFQSSPGLYVTANLYRPKKQTEPLPAVLYLCGHGRSVTDGISNGNKAHYQHHGAWFARNGYVCLIIDTIQLGEFEGIHHGTYREKMWWWNNRGYTPAGVEAWNCIRSLDYLQSRPEVDAHRIGVTGRSGGGAYSWWIAALDDRIKAAVPVAGITSLRNHVVDGCVEGHCDCMYMVNTYRWDYAMVAALVAPRPLLISNTDKDRIFPLDGVVDVYSKTRKIYSLYDARDKLGLHITEGPHKDTQELRVHAFRWLNRWLKHDDSLIETVATKYFEPHELRVFDKLPEDQIVTRIHESFVPTAHATLPRDDASLRKHAKDWKRALRGKAFGGWPSGDLVQELAVTKVHETKAEFRVREFQFDSQTPYRLPFWVIQKSDRQVTNGEIHIQVVDQQKWTDSIASTIETLTTAEAGDKLVSPDSPVNQMGANDTWIVFAPRGVGSTRWNTDERKATHIRRRFMQLGQTIASMQVWDVRRMLQAIDSIPEFSKRSRTIAGSGNASVWVAYASLFEPHVGHLILTDLPSSHRQSPPLLNVSRFATLPQILMMAAEHSSQGVTLHVDGPDRPVWSKFAEGNLLADKFTISERSPSH